MKRITGKILLAVLIALPSVFVSAQAPARNTRAGVAQQVGQTLSRIDAGLSRYRASLDTGLSQGRLNGTDTERQANDLFQNLDEAAGRMQKLFAQQQLASTDVWDLLDQATKVDDFMRSARLGRPADADWLALRNDISELARSYGVQTQWEGQSAGAAGSRQGQTAGADSSTRPAPTPRNTGRVANPPRDDNSNYDNGLLTGTYQIDPVRSDDVKSVATRAARSVPVSERQRLSESLIAKLESPAELALDQRGTSVTVGGSRTAPKTYEADGQYRTERAPNGSTLRTRAMLDRDIFEVRVTGERNDGYVATYETVDNGRTLRVSRQVVDTRIPQPVVVVSVYEKISGTAQLDAYPPARNTNYGNDNQSGGAYDDFLLGDGVQVVAALDQDLSTKTSRENDRFTMTVRSPAQYEGAVIEGYVSGLTRSGRVSGRSKMVLNFERIRLLDGATYRFAATLEAITSTNGEKVKIDEEGAVTENENRTGTTAKRSGGGAAAGAAIGGILGGGKGAAIGAVIGAGTGAGTVAAEGRDDLQVLRGSAITVRASAPRTRS